MNKMDQRNKERERKVPYRIWKFNKIFYEFVLTTLKDIHNNITKTCNVNSQI